MPRSGSYTSAVGSNVYVHTLIYCNAGYRLLPSSHVAHGVLHPGIPGRSNVRNNITSPAAQPPSIAVTVKYIFSRAAAVIARSVPPGIEVILFWFRMRSFGNINTHGFIAILQIA